jgi:hypothetical protein
MRFLAPAFAAWLLVMPAGVAGQNVGSQDERAAPTPASVKGILLARRFTLQTPYTNTWSRERGKVSRGTFVVLEVDPAYVDPRDVALNPVLYAGDATVIRLNHGSGSGRVIGIIPGDVDLATTPIWFGSPELPERVTQDVVRVERARAEKAGLRPFPATRIASVERPAVAAADLAALLRDVAAQLVYEYSPQEKRLADTWRLPEAKATPKKYPN